MNAVTTFKMKFLLDFISNSSSDNNTIISNKGRVNPFLLFWVMILMSFYKGNPIIATLTGAKYIGVIRYTLDSYILFEVNSNIYPIKGVCYRTGCYELAGILLNYSRDN